MTTKANISETLVDVATRIYGHVTGVFWLLEDNQNLRIDHIFTSDTLLATRPESVRLLEVGQVTFKVARLPKYQVLEKQSLFDIVIENQGSILGAFDISEANEFNGITEHIFINQELEILETAIAPRVRDSLAKDMPITTISEADKSDGIGYMYIIRNFKIR